MAAEAVRDGVDLVVVAGGDGTLNEAVNGLGRESIPLAVVPLGTVNVFARETGIPYDLEQACEVALNGIPTSICLGQAGDTRFIQMAGVGFDARAVLGLSPRLKRWTGRAAYLVSAFGALVRWRSRPIEMVTTEGNRLTVYNVVIGNGRLYGGRFSITPGACLTDDVLEVCAFLRRGRGPLLRSLLRIGTGRHGISEDVLIFKTTALDLSGADIPVQTDGDYLGQLPMSFRAISGELTVLLPQNPGPTPT